MCFAVTIVRQVGNKLVAGGGRGGNIDARKVRWRVVRYSWLLTHWTLDR